MMSFWSDGGQIITDQDGRPIECASCPCSSGCCADGGGSDALWLYGYFAAQSLDCGVDSIPGCFDLACACADNGHYSYAPAIYQTFGQWTGGSFTWNRGSFSTIGKIGCVNVRLIGACGKFDGTEPYTDVFRLTIDFDLGDGAGYVGAGEILGVRIYTDHGGDVTATTAKCDPPATGCIGVLGGGLSSVTAYDVFPSFLLADYDISAGVRVPDGHTYPITLTFSVTVLGPDGVTPTLYSCDIHFAPDIGGGLGCYAWFGHLADCSPIGCTEVWLYYDGTNWDLRVVTNGNLRDFDDVHTWSDASFPTGTNYFTGTLDNLLGPTEPIWPGCSDPTNAGIDMTGNPPWSIT